MRGVSTEYTNVTDRQTDGRTNGHRMTTAWTALMYSITRQKYRYVRLVKAICRYNLTAGCKWLTLAGDISIGCLIPHLAVATGNNASSSSNIRLWWRRQLAVSGWRHGQRLTNRLDGPVWMSVSLVTAWNVIFSLLLLLLLLTMMKSVDRRAGSQAVIQLAVHWTV